MLSRTVTVGVGEPLFAEIARAELEDRAVEESRHPEIAVGVEREAEIHVVHARGHGCRGRVAPVAPNCEAV